MKRMFAKFLSDESGATAIEYGLIAAGISIAIIVAVNGQLDPNFALAYAFASSCYWVRKAYGWMVDGSERDCGSYAARSSCSGVGEE